MPKRIRFLFITAFLALVFFGLGVLIVTNKQSTNNNMQRVAGSAIGGAYTLVDHMGRDVTDKNFEGQHKLIYFGFTYCPAICPTELQKISRVMDVLDDAAADKIQPIFITIDPERDTVEVMRSYVEMFHPKMIGLTGGVSQIKDVLKTYRVYAKKAWEEGATEYTMDHSSYIYFMSPNDDLISIYRVDDTTEYIVADVIKNM